MVTIINGDCRDVLKTLPDASVNCCVTSPPYFGLRDYGVAGQIGLEQTPDAYVAEMVGVFREVRRVLREDGTLWLNLGDSYAGYHGNKNAEIPTSSTNGWTNGYNENKRGGARPQDIGLKPKDLIGIPWRVAFALQAAGWYLRQDVIWHKPNPMPESVTDRCTKAHEYVFLLSKSARYYYDAEAVMEQAVRGAAGSQFHTGKTGLHQAGRASTKPRKSDSTNSSFVPGANDHNGLHREGTEREPETRNRRSVWTIPTKPYKGAHFATFPPALVEPCILAGCPAGGVVLDPFGGSGTTGQVASSNGRRAVLIELNPSYVELGRDRCGLFTGKAREPVLPTLRTEAT